MTKDCPCCMEAEIEYTCEICDNGMCRDCLHEDYIDYDFGRIQFCEDCYNNGGYDKFIEEL